MSIIIDNRETGLIKKVKQLVLFNPMFKKINIIIESLPIGDILFKVDNEDKIVIERKTIKDLLSSIKDGRYSEQSYRLNGLINHNHNIIYLIEGNVNEHNIFKKECDKNVFFSSMFSLNYIKGFSVTRTFGIDESAFFICNSFLKLLHPKSVSFYETSPNEQSSPNEHDYTNVIKKVKKNNITINNIDEILLCQIPSISSVTAKAIIKSVGSLKDMFLKYQDHSDDIFSNIKYVNEKGQERKVSKTSIENIKRYLLKSETNIVK